VKLDGDLWLPPPYFQSLLERFALDPGLGIASGVYLEHDGNNVITVQMPEYHAAGASKMVRIECFDQIGGFISAKGWDTIDEIRAHTLGWTTRHFTDIKFAHLRAEGSVDGRFQTGVLHGEVYFVTGGSFVYFIFKLLYRIKTHRTLLAGLALLTGYVRALLTRQRLVSSAQRNVYNNLLRKRLVDRVLRRHYTNVFQPFLKR
jgi:hypothetical protein